MRSLTERQVGTRIAKMLQDSQHEHGFIQTSEIQRISDQVGEPIRVIQDVISFFPHFRKDAPPKCHAYVCRDMSCRLRGSVAMSEQLRSLQTEVGKAALEITEASCLGRCDRAPAVFVNEDLYVNRTAEEMVEIVRATLQGRSPEPDRDVDTATIAFANAEIDYYAKTGTPLYTAVKQYVLDPEPARVVKALETSGLQGMGGAGMPAFSKWEETKNAPGEVKYVVCNADESEPGTFKDRDILLASPHLVIEGMIIAGLVTGAKRGFIYIRHEYFEQIARLNEAIDEAIQLKACGTNIFGSTLEFRLEVFVSPGGYVCGEQTALIEALEGKRSEPRNRPPELQTNGLYNQPTVLNNVETFAWVPAILLYEPLEKTTPDGKTNPEEKSVGKPSTQGVWYRKAGRNGMKGKRFFSISGDLNRPGAYEVPCGLTLGELIDDYAGGMKDGCALQAVALSGPSGGFLPAWLPKGSIRSPKKMDKEGKPTQELKYPNLVGDPIDVRCLPLDLNAGREIGFMLGAGLVVYGEHAEMLDQAIACSRFYQRESCGKCVPCRLGSRKMVDIAEELLQARSDSDPAELKNMVDTLSGIMETTSICGLGQVASNPLKSYLKYFYKPRVARSSEP
ncbi:MAG: NAD(P)H-dependent oxidoreductase subunit E [Planctomycetota bacterium]|nr:NAD(P)H-dependent oxidoreductase subunit E [Planctomycetota bacterium]